MKKSILTAMNFVLIAVAHCVVPFNAAQAADTFVVTVQAPASEASLNWSPVVQPGEGDPGTFNNFKFVDLRGFTGFQFSIQGTSCFFQSGAYNCGWTTQAVTVQVSLDKGKTWRCLGGSGVCVWRTLPTSVSYFTPLAMTDRTAIPLEQRKNNALLRIAFDDQRAHPEDTPPVTGDMTLQLYR